MFNSINMVASVAMSAFDCSRSSKHKLPANEGKWSALQACLCVAIYHTLHFLFGFISVSLAHMKEREKIMLFCKA